MVIGRTIWRLSLGFRPMLDRSSVSVGRRLGALDPYEVDRLSVDCCPTLCRSQSQKKKKKKSVNDRRKKYNLAPSTKNYQPTRKQPKSDTTSTDGPSTVASYVLFWPRRRRPLVGLGNVTALQELKLSTDVRGNYSACRCMTISYPERSLYISFRLIF